MQKLPVLRSDRLVLSPATERAAETILACVEQHPEVPKNFSFFGGRVPSVEEERAYLARMRKSPLDALFVIRTREGEFIGTCGLHDIDGRNDNARLGYILFDADAHGKGFAQEAVNALLWWGFETLHLNKVYLNVFAENIAALTTDIRVGFQYEGRLRAHYRIHGAYHDVFHMSMLRSEWEKRNKKEESDGKETGPRRD